MFNVIIKPKKLFVTQIHFNRQEIKVLGFPLQTQFVEKQ